jgi:hypothetical protein
MTDPDDVLERAKSYIAAGSEEVPPYEWDLICALSAEVERLRATLREIHMNAEDADRKSPDQAQWVLGVIAGVIRRRMGDQLARQVLGDGEERRRD